jgi:hypothetical protein
MGFEAAIANDWTVWDDPEAVTVQSTRNAQQMTDVIRWAARQEVTLEEAGPSAGAYQKAGCVFLLPRKLVSWPLKPGDLITDGDGVVWTAQKAELAAARLYWRMTCLDLQVLYDLADDVDVEACDFRPDAAGSPVRVFPPDAGRIRYASLLANVQPIESEPREERGILGQVTHYEVKIGQQATDVSTDDRLAWYPQGRKAPPVYLEVRGVEKAQRLDELPTIKAELVP